MDTYTPKRATNTPKMDWKNTCFLGKKVAEVGTTLPPLRFFFLLPKTSSGFGWYPTAYEEKNCKIVFEGLLGGSLTIDNDSLCLRDDLLPYLCGTFGFETLPCLSQQSNLLLRQKMCKRILSSLLSLDIYWGHCYGQIFAQWRQDASHFLNNLEIWGRYIVFLIN